MRGRAAGWRRLNVRDGRSTGHASRRRPNPAGWRSSRSSWWGRRRGLGHVWPGRRPGRCSVERSVLPEAGTLDLHSKRPNPNLLIWLTVETPRQPFSWGLRPSGPIHRLARDHKINCNSPAAKKSLRLRRALALLVPRAQSISRRRSLSPFRRLIFQQSDGLPGTSSDARPAEDACDAACSGMRTENGRQEKAREGRETNGW